MRGVSNKHCLLTFFIFSLDLVSTIALVYIVVVVAYCPLFILILTDYRRYGVPTIRTDLPAPRIRRVDDRKNYGDESDAYGLVNPSVFSLKGVYEKDFLLPRSKEEVCSFIQICFILPSPEVIKLFSFSTDMSIQGFLAF